MDYDLERFVTAQNEGAGFASTYQDALQEVRNGYKATHWIWYVFPQLTELGRSYFARLYGISGMDEARAYLRHNVLGPRLVQISQAVLEHEAADKRAMYRMFGPIDCKKVRSSMTLFSRAAAGDPAFSVFGDVLDKFYGGQEDTLTLELLGIC